MNEIQTLDELIQNYMDGTASQPQVDELNRRLRIDQAALDEFIETLNLDAGVASLLADGVAAPSMILAATDHQVQDPRKRTRYTWLSAMAVCLMVSLIVFFGWLPKEGPVLATISISTAGEAFPEGRTVRGEWLHLSTGAMEMVTSSGARVAIEAPAQLRLESPQKLHLKSGRLAAEIPPSAKGFTVVTPSGSAVDLGTMFGVDVSNDQETEIHVFQGEVIAHTSSTDKGQNLFDGDAVQMKEGTGVSRDLRSSAFIRPEEVEPMRAALAFGRKQKADLVANQLRNDPDLIALLDFESPSRFEGVYHIVQGRWPGSHAPEFKSVGDHIKLNLGGDREFPQLTMAAWVRLDELKHPYQSLLHTDNWFESGVPGQIHWMVTDAKSMRLAMLSNQHAPDEIGQPCDADSQTPVFSEQRRWIHLAVTYDSQERLVKFYLNGVFDNQVRFDIAHPARLGPSQIGNWNTADRKLSGRIDELLLLERVASDDEIKAIFDAGNPYVFDK